MRSRRVTVPPVRRDTGRSPNGVFATRDASHLRLPPGGLGHSYLVALDDRFFVYPTKLREYQARYRGSFQHGGVTPEEVIVPVALLTPRGSR